MSSPDTAALERGILRVHLSRRDFHKASQFISAAKACDNNVVREALLISALVCYSRPFSRPVAMAKSGFADRASDSGMLDTPQIGKALHDRLISLRGRTVTEEDLATYPLQLEPTRRGKSSKVFFTPQRFRSRTWSVLRESIDLDAFTQLADDMHERCTERLTELSDQLNEVQPYRAGSDPD
jgi:hypothetical protein